MRLLRQAMVIARRDFRATVVSRSFILFLIGPLLAMAFGGLIGQVADSSDRAALRPALVVLASPGEDGALLAHYRRIAAAAGEDALPALSVERRQRDESRQVARLSGGRRAVLLGWPDSPHLIGDKRAIEQTRGLANLLLSGESGRGQVRLIEVPSSVQRADPAQSKTGRHLLARVAQTMLFMLSVLLAGMLLSNLVEEKSNKVIEVLASAVPVDAIFLGKLIAMLGVSLTGIAVWGSVLAAGASAFLPANTSLPVPATGWAVFIVLGFLYYIMNYLIIGGVFLGLGAQASSVREVQTLSMPATMAQLGLFALASTAVGDLSRPVVMIASAFPLSSPLTMIARAAQEGLLWPHLLALAWQALWVVLIVRFAARRFRTGVLKSGPQAKAR